MEMLLGVKSIDNTDKYTILQITTDKGVHEVILPFKKKTLYSGDKHTYEYTVSVLDYCIANKIRVREYLHIIADNNIV